MSDASLMRRHAQDLIDPEQLLAINAGTEEEWAEQGRALGYAERVVGWAIGAWWNAGEKFGRRIEIVRDPAWQGPSYGTCRNYGSAASRFDLSRRVTTLTVEHHRAVLTLPPEKADEFLARAAEIAVTTGKVPEVRLLRQWAKAETRGENEVRLAAKAERESKVAAKQLYSVILADPPWRFEPRSRESGMDRAADNHYPTLSTDEICAMEVSAAKNCVLFLWSTAPMMLDAARVMAAWGFNYKSQCIWTKPNGTTGYWFNSAHEILLLGVRGQPPAPAPGTQFLSWQQAKPEKRKHSMKPAIFMDMIDEMFPSQRGLEMFARSGRPGWDAHGYEAPP